MDLSTPRSTRIEYKVNGLHELALTKLDCHSGLHELKVVVGYRLDGRVLASPPPLSVDLARVEPEYRVLSGWEGDITGETKFDRLPAEAQRYVRLMEDWVGCPIKWIGTGPDRDHLIRR